MLQFLLDVLVVFCNFVGCALFVVLDIKLVSELIVLLRRGCLLLWVYFLSEPVD